MSLFRSTPRIAIAFAAGAAVTLLVVFGLPRLWRSHWPGTSGKQARLIIVGVDGADWNLIDPLLARGEMPNMARLIERGARARLLSFQPMLSPVLWTTIATGVRPEKHGIIDFVAVSPETGRAIPVTSSLRRAPAFWNLLGEAGMNVGVTAWWATYPAEKVKGYMVSDRIAYQLFGMIPDEEPRGKTYPPEIYEEIRSLIVDPSSIDEAAIAAYLGPAVGGSPSEERSEMEKELRAIVASGETYRRIAARLADRFHPQVEAVYVQSTDTIAHLAMRFREPLLPGVDPDLARRFAPAVDEAYREADRILGEIVARAGTSTDIIICSDHGFRSGADRPASTDSRIEKGKAADWHRKFGILVLAGPHVSHGAEVKEASILDVAPTLLALLGQPIPESFQGRALVEAFTEEFLREHPLRSAPATPSESPPPNSLPAAGGGDEKAVLEKLVSLGYLSQDTLNARNNRGILHMNRGEFDQAIKEFEAAIAQEPAQPGVLINLGRCQWLSGDPARGKATLEKAMQMDPKAKEAENILGNIEMSGGDLDEAERHFRRALAIEPDYTDAHNSLGILMETRGRLDEAIAEYRRATEVDPDYAEAYNNIGNVLKNMRKVQEAESWYRRAIDADPTFAGSYNNLALILQDRGDFAGAEELYKRSLKSGPDEPKAHNNLGSLYFRRGEIDKALAEFKSAARLDETYAEARNSMGAAYGALGRHKEEIEAYREALRLKPDYPDAHYNLGLTLLRSGQTADGKKEIERAVSLQPRHAPALVTLCGIALREGKNRAAVDDCRRAVEANPGDAPTRLALGQALAATGNPEAARKELLRTLEIDGSLEEARRFLGKLPPGTHPGS